MSLFIDKLPMLSHRISHATHRKPIAPHRDTSRHIATHRNTRQPCHPLQHAPMHSFILLSFFKHIKREKFNHKYFQYIYAIIIYWKFTCIMSYRSGYDKSFMYYDHHNICIHHTISTSTHAFFHPFIILQTHQTREIQHKYSTPLKHFATHIFVFIEE